MKRILLVPTFLLVYFCTIAQTAVKKPAAKSSSAPTSDGGYSISTTLTPYKNGWLYLATYFGKNYVLVDSARTDANSHSLFQGNNKLTPGIYFYVSPARTKLFEILVDNGQHFSVVGDSAHPEAVKVTGSPDNTLFFDYTAFLNGEGPKMNEIQVKLKNPNLTKADEDSLKAQAAVINKKMNDYRENIRKNHPESLLAFFFKVLSMPEVPASPVLPNGKVDSTFPGRYVKTHFWDNVAFNDDRLLHTPFFDGKESSKLEEYLKYYVSPDPDSIFSEINYMLLYARGTKEMEHYLLGRFTDKYINPEIMGQDKVFLGLFKNYFLKGDTMWLNATQRKYIFDKGYSLWANQIGDVAPALNLVDTAGKPVSLYDVKAPFTFVVFWDPTCSHCKVQVPEVDSIYEAKWKSMGIKVFAVNNNEATPEEWKTFIREHHLDGWIHAWQTKEDHAAETKDGVANYRQLYNIFQTPTMYLLDANKRIIAKSISVLQFDDFITAKLKQQSAATR
jgi:peroxiredoxin